MTNTREKNVAEMQAEERREQRSERVCDAAQSHLHTLPLATRDQLLLNIFYVLNNGGAEWDVSAIEDIAEYFTDLGFDIPPPYYDEE